MIGILTYDVPHRKTQDLIRTLLFRGVAELHIIATPFIERKNFQPLFVHRPTKAVQVNLDEMCKNLAIRLTKIEVQDLNKFFDEQKFDHILIGGAGILPEELVVNHKIINAHPGYLPLVRGLDALKWAIFNEKPIGVTSHFISEKADEGDLIERKLVPLYFEDTFHSFAYRQYEMEIALLANSIDLVKNKTDFELLQDESSIVNRRMPHHLELIMMNKFEELRKKAPSYYEAK